MKDQSKEDKFQTTIASYMAKCYPAALWTHISNKPAEDTKLDIKGEIYSAAADLLKRKGVKSGVPVLLIFDRYGTWSGLAIELKVDQDKPTEEQLHWLKMLHNRNWATLVSDDLDVVLKGINDYYSSKFVRRQAGDWSGYTPSEVVIVETKSKKKKP